MDIGQLTDAKASDSAPRKTKRRMARADRERQILKAAITFFAEHGLGGNTRELAQQLHITQPLLYKYFPTKNDLIARVFQEMFFDRFDRRWGDLISDRSRPIAERLREFYREYSRATYSYEWMRLYLSAGLTGWGLNARYIRHVEKELLRPLCNEIRVYCRLPDQTVIPISRAELDYVWVFHGGFFYYAMRKHIYHAPITEDFEILIDRAVTVMLEGLRSVTSRAPADGPRDEAA